VADIDWTTRLGDCFALKGRYKPEICGVSNCNRPVYVVHNRTPLCERHWHQWCSYTDEIGIAGCDSDDE
jgi:hypothetical protein